jgi:hypothetical protein
MGPCFRRDDDVERRSHTHESYKSHHCRVAAGFPVSALFFQEARLDSRTGSPVHSGPPAADG